MTDRTAVAVAEVAAEVAGTSRRAAAAGSTRRGTVAAARCTWARRAVGVARAAGVARASARGGRDGPARGATTSGRRSATPADAPCPRSPDNTTGRGHSASIAAVIAATSACVGAGADLGGRRSAAHACEGYSPRTRFAHFVAPVRRRSGRTEAERDEGVGQSSAAERTTTEESRAACCRACGAGSSSRLVRSISRPATILRRVSAGSMTSSMIAPLGGGVRVGVLLGVLGDQLGPAGDRVGGLLQLAAVDDLDRALRAHHGQLGGRPGVATRSEPIDLESMTT